MRAQRGQDPDDRRRGHPDDGALAGQDHSPPRNPIPVTTWASTRVGSTRSPSKDAPRLTNSAVPRQMRMLVRMPAAFPRAGVRDR